MIRFWKSVAAKGETGCPTRTLEENSPSSSINTLDPQILKENEHPFVKKSKLNISLQDILIGNVALYHFTKFMESLHKNLLLESWLEFDNFKLFVRKLTNNTESSNCDLMKQGHMDNNTKLSSLFSASTQYDNTFSRQCNENNSSESPNSIDTTEKAVSLFKKYIALESTNHLDLPDEIRKQVISNICQPGGQVQEDCFQHVQEFLFKEMEDNYLSIFQKSHFYVKAQIDILTSESLSLKDIIYNETILFYFTEFLEQESCRTLLEFIMAIIHFKDSLNNSNCTRQQAEEDAIVIYDKYFSLQATSPMSFPTEIRLEIESEICKEGGPLSSCFDVPFQIIYKTLDCCVKRFFESDLYYKYLSEMIQTVNKGIYNRAQSDCSSEYSVSTQNTLLAMGDSVFNKRRRNNSVPDMTIDSNQLYNADALWQRKRQDGLILGRINSLGRFESKFEPDPDKNRRSVLRKMVNRFVPQSSSKVQEEMAWQIAHKIVKDVTDLTMAPPDNEHDDL